MDSSRRVRQNVVLLQSNDLSSLKVEIADHLARISNRQPKDIVLQSQKIPLGLASYVEAGSEIEGIMPFPLAGTLQDFMSYVPNGVGEVYVQVTVVDKTGSQRVETRLQDSFRSYSIKANVTKTSYAKVKIMNKSKVAVDCVFGFTFKEVLPNEVEATGLIGNLESGVIT